MSFIKTSLKAAKEALLKQNYEDALEFSNNVLEKDPDNYNALIFKGKALDVTNKLSDSAHTYKHAIAQKPKESLAWKGLLALYERAEDWPNYLDAFVGLVKCFEANDELTPAHAALIRAQKITKHKKVGKDEQIYFLKLQLPGSPIYDFLRSHMVDSPTVVSRLIEIIEAEESKIFKTGKKNVDISKSNANSKKFEIMSTSDLPLLYQDMMDYSQDDSERRKAEESMFNYNVELLRLCPAKEKGKKRNYHDKVIDLISGIMVIKAPVSTAWTLGLNWKDPKSLGDLSFEELCFYISTFDQEGTAKVLQGFLHSKLSPFPIIVGKSAGASTDISPEEPEEAPEGNESKKSPGDEGIQTGDIEGFKTKNGKKEKKKKPSNKRKQKKTNSSELELWPEFTVLEYLAEGFDIDSQDILSFRIVGEFYLKNQEYETAVDVAQKGLTTLKKLESDFLVKLPNSRLHLSVILASSYIFYQAPKNYDLAESIFHSVLKVDKDNIDAKVGKGLILRERGNLQQAHTLLEEAVKAYPNNYQLLFEYSICLLREGYDEEGRGGLQKCLENVPRTDLVSTEFFSSILWEIGNSWAERKNHDKAFEYFVKTLQENPNYGPAYTSLGNYFGQVVNDQTRASKCYYKAFELDSGEIEAAEKLAIEFSAKSEWDMVEVIAGRVASSDKIRLGSGESSWPYRALGVVAINHGDFGKAVVHFQRALRMNSKDTASWVGLGESYMGSGRYVAGSKAFERALLLDDTLWTAKLQLALSQKEMFQFSLAISTLKDAISHLDGEDLFKVRCNLLETLVQSAKYYFVRDYYGEAVSNVKELLELAVEILSKDNISTQNIWRCATAGAELFLQVGSKLTEAPLELIDSLIRIGSDIHDEVEIVKGDEEDAKSQILNFMIVASLFAEAASDGKKPSRALAAYNLGLCFLKAHNWDEGDMKRGYLDQSVEYLRTAIQLEPRNSEYWNTYGIASAHVNSRVAQHCFIRSLRFNENQPDVWGNLAALYLNKDDLELALQAFGRVQSIDPENAISWLGLAIVNFSSGEGEKARKFFEHSFLLSKGNNYLSKLVYGLSVYEDNASRCLKMGYQQELDSGILGLEKLLIMQPDNETGLQIQGSLLERDGNYDYAAVYISHLAEVVEKRYERTNSETDVIKYALVKSQLARLHLGSRKYDQALNEAETALSLGSDEANILSDCVLSSLLTAGLASFGLNDFDQSIEYFKRALEISGEDSDVIVLLVRVLWAHGGESEREVAIEQLYSSINVEGSTPIKVTILLGIIGLFGNQDLQEAAEEELQRLPIEELQKDREYHIPEVLSLITKSNGPWQDSATYWPTSYPVWRQLDRKMALQVAQGGGVTPEELGDAYAEGNRNVDGAQMGIFLAPWKEDNWRILSEVVVDAV